MTMTMHPPPPLTDSPTDHSQRSYLINPCKFFPASITVNHWQLRDLVHTSSTKPNMVYYPSKDEIKRYNLRSDKTATYCTVDFNPRCFKELDGIVVSGGVFFSGGPMGSWKGLFSVYNPETTTSKTMRIGSLINNSVSIYKRNCNKYQSILCNNDNCLYFVDVCNTGITSNSSINMNYSLNHSSLSPDGKTLVAVGDCSSVFVVHPDSPNKRPQIIDAGCESGFSTCFNRSGTQVSCCFQEGVSLIYDVRKFTEPLHKITSTRRSGKSGAFRCTKYSNDIDDLLVISEHLGRVHLVDTRDFSNHQVIMLPNLIGSKDCEKTPVKERDDEMASIPLIYDYNYVLENFSSSDSSNMIESYWDYSSRTMDNSISDSSDVEITGVDFISSSSSCSSSYLVVGVDKGIIKWKINSASRRCFPSYSVL